MVRRFLVSGLLLPFFLACPGQARVCTNELDYGQAHGDFMTAVNSYCTSLILSQGKSVPDMSECDDLRDSVLARAEQAAHMTVRQNMRQHAAERFQAACDVYDAGIAEAKKRGDKLDGRLRAASKAETDEALREGNEQSDRAIANLERSRRQIQQESVQRKSLMQELKTRDDRIDELMAAIFEACPDGSCFSSSPEYKDIMKLLRAQGSASLEQQITIKDQLIGLHEKILSRSKK